MPVTQPAVDVLAIQAAMQDQLDDLTATVEAQQATITELQAAVARLQAAADRRR